MYQTADIWEAIHHAAPEYEITLNGPAQLDFKALKEKRDKYIVRLNNIYLNGLKNAGIDVLEGWASFVDAHTVQVAFNDGTKQSITAAHILIAVGGKPMLPSNTEGIEHTITSDGFFELTELPKKSVVVGVSRSVAEMAYP